MGYRITLAPSGRVFQAEAQETLLEAGLRSGVNLAYNCSGGSCGVCKARVVEGTVGLQRFHDFPLGAAEKERGYVLLCSVGAASDMTVEVEEIGDVRDISRQHLTAHVVKVESLGDHYIVLNLRTPRTQTLQFLPGQHVSLTIPDGPCCDLVLASCPCSGMFLEFHLEHRRDDPFTEYVASRLHHNDRVEVDGPFGAFALDEASTRPLVMVALDTGFAPFKSLIEHAIALELSQPIVLFWLSTYEDGQYMANLCRSWVDAVDNFTFQPLYLVEGQEEAMAQVIAESVAEPQACDLYVAASFELAAALRRTFIAAGTPSGRIFMKEKRECTTV